MRLIAIHDADGRIFTLVTSPPDSPPCAPAFVPGQIATEIDPGGVDISADAGKLPDRLREIAEQYRVERGSPSGASGRLTRRTGK
jgi:hypothetical protein